MKTKRLTRMALLTGIALIIFMVEAQLPTLVPIPGLKLGLANIITLYAMFVMGPADTLLVLLARILLGGMFAGQMMTLLYSFVGGLMCYCSMLLMRKVLTLQQIWVCSVVGAVFHNIGQILVAILVTRTPGIAAYLPALLISGILTGLFTGLCAQYVVGRSKDLNP